MADFKFIKIKEYLWHFFILVLLVVLCLLAYFFDFKLEYNKNDIISSLNMIIGFSLVLYSFIFSLMGIIINSISEINPLFKIWGSFKIRGYFEEILKFTVFIIIIEIFVLIFINVKKYDSCFFIYKNNKYFISLVYVAFLTIIELLRIASISIYILKLAGDKELYKNEIINQGYIQIKDSIKNGITQ